MIAGTHFTRLLVVYYIAMIPVKYRFHGHGSLRYLFKNAQAVRSRHITIKYIANSRRKHSRFSVVVSKKVHKSAVGRNRMRRRLYELVRLEIPKLNGTYDVALIITNSEVMSMEYVELEAGIRELFTQAGLYSRDD